MAVCVRECPCPGEKEGSGTGTPQVGGSWAPVSVGVVGKVPWG